MEICQYVSLYFAYIKIPNYVSFHSNNDKITRIRNFCGRYCEGWHCYTTWRHWICGGIMMSIGWCSRCVGWVMIRWFRWCSQWSEGCCCGGRCVVCIYFLVGVCKVQQRVTTWVSTIFFRNLNLQWKAKKSKKMATWQVKLLHY